MAFDSYTPLSVEVFNEHGLVLRIMKVWFQIMKRYFPFASLHLN